MNLATRRKRFAIVGVAGFVAPRHLKAIFEIEGDVVAACDPHDSVGILDTFFPNAAFFTEFERFDRHLDKLRRSGDDIDYLVVCSPNYLHDAHIRFGLRSGANVICEKPLVLNPWNLDRLKAIEDETGRTVFSILQLRHHPTYRELKNYVNGRTSKRHQVQLKYVTPRGRWYHSSWKGNDAKSGGIGTNIGVHLFDLLVHVFGPVDSFSVSVRTNSQIAGTLSCSHADITWHLSIDMNDLPSGSKSLRLVQVGEEHFDFSEGFTDLHSASYEAILSGNGFGIADVYPSIELISQLRSCETNVRLGAAAPQWGQTP